MSFYFARCVCKIALYSDVIPVLIRLEISHRTMVEFKMLVSVLNV